MPDSCGQQDLLNRNTRWLLWRVPWAVVVIGTNLDGMTRMLLWTPAYLVMSAACTLNVTRCGRLHCYITGPLYLLAAVATVLATRGLVPLKPSWVLWGALIGTVLAYVPEWLRGRYVVGDH